MKRIDGTLFFKGNEMPLDVFSEEDPEYESSGLWPRRCAHVAQLAEHVLGKDEVTGSIPVPGSSIEELRRPVRSSLVMSGGNSGVESLPSKQMVAGSNPVPRSRTR